MNYWILQSNPNKYRQVDYMRAHRSDPKPWSISRYGDEIEIGDVVFIWVSNEKGKNNRGIYAMGEITELPIVGRRFEREDPYWIDREEKRRLLALPRLELRYTEIVIDKPLLVEELRTKGLGDLPIINMPQRSIYRIIGDEGEKIREIIERR